MFSANANGSGTSDVFTTGQTATFSSFGGADVAGTSASRIGYSVSVDTNVTTAGISFKDSYNDVSLTAGGGTLTLSAPTVTVADNGTASIAAPIAGTAGLTKTGTGTLTLSGNNSYSGLTTIAAGALSISSDSNLGTATNGITFNGGTLQTMTDVTLTSTRAVNGEGVFNISPATTLTVNGTYGAATPGLLTLSNAGTLRLAGTTNAAAGLIISAPGTLNASGGALTFSDHISTTHTAGTAVIAGAINAGAGSIRNITVADGSADRDLIISANISGTSIDKYGAGTLELSGTNTYSGTTYIDEGVLVVSADANLGATTTPLYFYTTTSTLRVENDLTLGSSRPVQGTGIFDIAPSKALTINGTYGASNPGKITLINSGKLQLNGTTNSANGAVGGVSFTAPGTLNVSGSGALTLGGDITTSHTAGTATIAGKISAGSSVTRIVTVADGSADQDLVISAIISGSGASLSKAGPGTLILSNNNTYTGSTTVSSGTLALNGTSTTSGVSASGGTLNIGASGAVGTGTLTLGIASFDNTSGSPLSVTNPVTFNVSGTTTYIGTNTLTQSTGAIGLGSINHTLAISGSTLTLNGVISGAGTGSNTPVLTKTGNGKLVLGGANTTYGSATRGTAVVGGTLVASNATGTATGVGPVTVGDGTNANTGVLAGTGTASSTTAGIIGDAARTVAVQKGGTVTGGTGATATDAVGKLTLLGTTNFNAGGTYAFKIASTSGATTTSTQISNAGTNWDKIQMTTLGLTGLGLNNPFNIKVIGVSPNMSFLHNAKFEIANISGTAVTPNITDLFVIDTNGLGISRSDFSIVTGAGGSGYSLFLSYNGGDTQSAPEPGTAAIFGLGGSVLLGLRRRKGAAGAMNRLAALFGERQSVDLLAN